MQKYPFEMLYFDDNIDNSVFLRYYRLSNDLFGYDLQENFDENPLRLARL